MRSRGVKWGVVELVWKPTLVPRRRAGRRLSIRRTLCSVSATALEARCSLVNVARRDHVAEQASKRAYCRRPQPAFRSSAACRRWIVVLDTALGAGRRARNITSCRRGRRASSCSVMETVQRTLDHKQRLQLYTAALPFHGRKDGRFAPTRDMQTAARACSLQQRLV